MLVRTGYGARSLQKGNLLALSFTGDDYPIPIAIDDTPAKRHQLSSRRIRYYSDVVLRKHSNAYVLSGKRGGEEDEIITIGYTQPNIPPAASPIDVENDYFNFTDTITEFMLSVNHSYRTALATVLLMDCINNIAEDLTSLEDVRDLVFWKEAK